MVGIIDYGVGNLFSLNCSFETIGEKTIVSDDPKVLRNASHIILPGVGAFADAAMKLRFSGLDAFVKEQVKEGKPVMGICLGMQMLFERSFEYGEHPGLSILSGSVVPMEGKLDQTLKIPHMGWNQLHFKKTSRLFSHISDGDYVYFVHSYFAENCEDSLSAVTNYGIEMTAAVEKDNVFGCQFHPEKSGNIGLNILRAFCEV